MERVNWNQAVRPSTHDLIAAINSGADDIERIDGALVDIENALDSKAGYSGTYPDFVAGEALSIRSGIRSNTFLSRALDADVADGIAEIERVLGNTVVVNDELVSSNVAGIEGASTCEFPAQTLRGIASYWHDVMTRSGIQRNIGVGTISSHGTVVSGNQKYCSLQVSGVDSWSSSSGQPANGGWVVSLLGLTKSDTPSNSLRIGRTWNALYAYAPLDTADSVFDSLIGMEVYYLKANPTTEQFAEPLDLTYSVQADGSESWIVPDNTQSAAVTGEIAYPLDPARALITHESFADFIDKLGAYIGATITETWDGSKYTYSFASSRSALLGSIEAEPDALEVTEKDGIVKEIIEDERKEL